MRNLLPTVRCLGTRLRIEIHNTSLQRGSCHLFCGGIIDIIQINAWAQLLEAWLALTSVKYLDNVLVLILLNQWLKLTML